MELWELAVRRYKQIVPEPILKRHEFPAEKLLDWIRGEVCSAVEEVVRRPRFQEYACWPIQTFAEGAESEERQLLDCLRRQVPAVASTIEKLLAIPKVSAAVEAKYPSKRAITREMVRITGEGAEVIDRDIEEFDEFDWLASQISSLSAGMPGVLVDVRDYFSPLPQYDETESGEFIQRGEIIPSLNFRLHPVGDFVVQAMFARIETTMEILERISLDCQRIDVQRTRKIDELLEALSEQQNELESTKHRLEERLTMSRKVRLRNSCIILTQIYAAFHVRPDLSWLDLPEEIIARGAELIRHRITGWRNAEMADRIAAAVSDLGKLYRSDELTLSELDEAVAHKRLVLSRDTQEYYWDQTGPIRLKGKGWYILLALAESAKCGQAATISDVYGDTVIGDSTFATAVGRFQKKLPGTLSLLIGPGTAKQTYKLDLRRHEIKIF